MPLEPQQLGRRFASIAKWFAEFGARLTDVADQLRGPGTPPSQEVIEELQTARREFENLRSGVLELAATLSVAVPGKPADAVASLRDLEPLLQAVAAEIQAQDKRQVLVAARAEVFGVLDRVAAITHRDGADFAPLRSCQAKAQELRDAVAGTTSLDVEALLERWAAEARPFSDLLRMVEGQQAVDDERWSQLEESVAEAFGRPLAIAATRGRLVLRPR